MDSIKNVSVHSESLADGRDLPVGEVAHEVDLTLPENKALLEQGRIIKVAGGDAEPPVLTGEALNKRAAELEIEGRSNMNADELRAAVSEAEAKLAAGDNPDDEENAQS